VIRIEIDEPTLARTRIAISPLAEVATSVFLLRRNAPDAIPWPYDAWARRTREILRRRPELEAGLYYFRLAASSPDFFIPLPETALPTLEDQLDQLRNMPAELVEQQFDRCWPDADVSDELRAFRDDRRALERLADGVAAYWEATIAPFWPAMRNSLDEEVLLRARALAADGPDALLSRLHDRIRWQPPVLTLVKSLEYSFEAVDQRLLLVPLIFSRGALVCSSDHPDVVMVTYQSRGAAVLADGPAPAPLEDRLALLVGRGRASVLRALTVPATTTALATALGLAPSTVSEHLSGLQAAGVVHRRRAGRRVLYGLEPAGLALVNLLADDSGRTEFVS
jgi:DNA-binding transcriptional ArsR family regulator